MRRKSLTIDTLSPQKEDLSIDFLIPFFTNKEEVEDSNMFVKRGLLLSTLGFRDCHWQSFHPPVNFLFFSTSSSVIGDLECSVEVIMFKFLQVLLPFVKIIDW